MTNNRFVSRDARADATAADRALGESEAEATAATTLLSSRARTAYHEAGHALAYITHGRRFRYVTLRAHNAAGRVAVRPRRIPFPVHAVIAYAGPLAEARAAWLHEVGGDFDTLDEDGSDFDDYENGTWLVGGHDDMKLMRAAMQWGMSWDDTRDTALGIVEHRWPEIDALAATLLAATRALSYRECLAVTTTARPGS